MFQKHHQPWQGKPMTTTAVLQLGTLYQQPFVTCLHHHLVSAAVSRLNY